MRKTALYILLMLMIAGGKPLTTHAAHIIHTNFFSDTKDHSTHLPELKSAYAPVKIAFSAAENWEDDEDNEDTNGKRFKASFTLFSGLQSAIHYPTNSFCEKLRASRHRDVFYTDIYLLIRVLKI